MEIKKNFEEQNMSVIMHLLVLTTIIISNDVPVPNILKLVGFLNFWLQANFMKVIPETRRSHWNTCIYVLITHLFPLRRGVLDKHRLFSPGTPVSSTNKAARHDKNWNIVESGVKHHKSNQMCNQNIYTCISVRTTRFWNDLHEIRL
jgi:hypothetical protein